MSRKLRRLPHMLLERLCDPMLPRWAAQGGQRTVGMSQHSPLCPPPSGLCQRTPGTKDAPRWERDYTRQAVPEAGCCRGWQAGAGGQQGWSLILGGPAGMLTCIRISCSTSFLSSILRVSESKLWLGKRLSNRFFHRSAGAGVCPGSRYTHTLTLMCTQKLTGARMHAGPALLTH